MGRKPCFLSAPTPGCSPATPVTPTPTAASTHGCLSPILARLSPLGSKPRSPGMAPAAPAPEQNWGWVGARCPPQTQRRAHSRAGTVWDAPGSPRSLCRQPRARLQQGRKEMGDGCHPRCHPREPLASCPWRDPVPPRAPSPCAARGPCGVRDKAASWRYWANWERGALPFVVQGQSGSERAQRGRRDGDGDGDGWGPAGGVCVWGGGNVSYPKARARRGAGTEGRDVPQRRQRHRGRSASWC